MANPQLENGYTPIANELIEALARVNLSAYEHRVLFAILRKTYGWAKKADRIAISQFETLTGLKRRHVIRAVDSLRDKNIILVAPPESRKCNLATQYALQKNWQEWESIKVLPEEVTLTNTGNSYLETSKVLPVQVTVGITNLGNHNNKVKTNTKTKEEGGKELTDNFLQEMKTEFPELDIEQEKRGWELWWTEGDKKLKRPKTAFRNWLKIARQKLHDNGRKGNDVTHAAMHTNTPAGALDGFE